MEILFMVAQESCMSQNVSEAYNIEQIFDLHLDLKIMKAKGMYALIFEKKLMPYEIAQTIEKFYHQYISSQKENIVICVDKNLTESEMNQLCKIGVYAEDIICATEHEVKNWIKKVSDDCSQYQKCIT